MGISFEPDKNLAVSFWVAVVPLVFGAFIVLAWLFLHDSGLGPALVALGGLLLVFSLPCNMICILVLLVLILRRWNDAEFRSVRRARCLRMLGLLLLNYPAALSAMAVVAFNSDDSDVVSLINSSGRPMTRIVLKAPGSSGGRPLWAGDLSAGETKTIELRLEPGDGDGEVMMDFQVDGKSSACVAAQYVPAGGTSRVTVNPDLTCVTEPAGQRRLSPY